MKLLKQSERTIVPADNLNPSPIVIIVDDPVRVRQLLSQTANIPINQQPHAPQYGKTRRESRIRQLIDEERNILQDAFDEFGTAGKHLIGTLISWIVWRIVVPLSVLSALWMVVAESAELPM
jgi:hypothetical protein